jgi:hypothetical protein
MAREEIALAYAQGETLRIEGKDLSDVPKEVLTSWKAKRRLTCLAEHWRCAL